MTTPDHPDWNVAQAIAALIATGQLTGAAGGVPLLTGSNNLSQSGTVNILANSTYQTGLINLSQIGYELFVSALVDAAATQPGLQVELDWFDTVSGLQVAQDGWSLLGSNSAGGQQYMGTGPTKGNQVNIKVTNLDPAKQATVQLTLVQNSRVYVRDDWRQLTKALVPGFNLPNVDQAVGILCQASPNVGSGVTGQRVIMLYAGQCKLYVSGTLAFDVKITAFDPAIGLSPNTFTIFEDKVTGATGGFISDTIALPRASCLVFFTNNGGSSQTLGITVSINEVAP